MEPQRPRSLKVLRALLLVMACWPVQNALARLAVVQQYGVAPGMSPVVAKALLVLVGLTFLSACVGAFFLLGVSATLHWRLTFILPVLAAMNIVAAIVIIPEAHIGVGLVLDVYLCNGLLTIVLVALLLKRTVRAYFGI